MYAFEYQKASTLDEAGTALAADPAAKILAGGMSLLPAMKHRLAAPSRLVDIAGLDSLRGITLVAAGTAQARLRVGAAMRHHEVAESAQVRQTLPALAELAGKIGDPQIRARGTLGGSVANNDPAADYPAAVLGLNAVVITTQREIAGDDFFALCHGGQSLNGGTILSERIRRKARITMLLGTGRNLRPVQCLDFRAAKSKR